MPAECNRSIYASGDCEIDLARRELRVFGARVPVGGRAFEFIEVLARSAGELVTKSELMHRIWPGAVVMEATLHVHAAAVRKALGPHRNLLKTESGRGYRLLGDWTERHQDPAEPAPVARHSRVIPGFPASNLPAANSRLIGRSAASHRLQDLVSAYRLLTLTGPGGIGKTALALEVARRVLGEFSDGAWLVELASLSDPVLVPSTVASVLGLRLESDMISSEAVARSIGGRNLLLVLDNCEHLIDAAAALADAAMRFCPRVTILATSREVFRIEGEYVFRVPPLDVPPTGQMDAEQILGCSAAELFTARAKEHGSDFAARSSSLPTIGAICRHLDGIPLAIEFAAARAATLGIEQVAAGLRDRLSLLTSGRRTALPRHRTLGATLDWSYHLLPDAERLLLQRLAVFSGSFSLEAVTLVTNRGEASDEDITDRVANLVAKSLVTQDLIGDDEYFRLLETTRAYARARLTESGDLPMFARRHADYYRALFNSKEHEWDKRATPLIHLDNARAALEWCFGADGSVAIGVGLAAATVPLFLTMSLLPECRRWSEQAIRALDDVSRGGADEMQLQACFGISSMQMYGQAKETRAAMCRGFAIAEARGDVLYQVGLLGMLSMFEVREGDFKTSLRCARRSRSVEGITANSTAMALANSILGRALQFVGSHDESRVELEASFRHWSRSRQSGEVYLGLDHHTLVSISLSRNSWLQGHPRQAAEQVQQAIRDAETKNHPASLGLALSWAPEVFLWIGDLPSADSHADWLLAHAAAHSLRPYLAVGRGHKAAVAIARGDARAGAEDLEACLEQLDELCYRIFNTEFKLPLVQGFIALGMSDKGLALIDQTIRLVEVNGDLIHMPEALRVKGRVLLSMPQPRHDEAEACFLQSLDWSRRQGARSWELRTAVDLARLWAAHGQRDRAQSVLQPIFEAFAEGLETADLRAAERLLSMLR